MNAEPLYEIAVQLAVPALRLAAPFHERLRRGVTGRLVAASALHEFGATRRIRERPLLWLHAPSVGEGLMAQAILSAAKTVRPELQSAFTYFSPSAERVASRLGADWHGYLPWDRRNDVRAALNALQPSCVAFVRTEIWPVLVREASLRGIPVVMVNAVLADDSSRLGVAARAVLGRAYQRLAAVGAVSDADAANFPRLGVEPARIRITGDARFDQVVERVRTIDRSRPLLRALAAAHQPWLVAGSTWEQDEALLVPALAQQTSLAAVIAPHEPTRPHLERLERMLDAAGISHARLPADQDVSMPAARVLVVDRVGVLADLYAAAHIAYVGGGFGSAGLHSIIEPAALGVPVLYGPRHGNAREAERLAAAGGGFIVRDATSFSRALAALLESHGAHSRAAAAARTFVAAHTGAAARNARLIHQALAPA